MVNPYRSLLPATVGFDRLISTLNEVEELMSNKPKQSYPPYNIYRVHDEFNKTTIIEIATAGFSKGELDVSLEDNWVIVTGSQETNSNESLKEYIHRGLGARNFQHKFKISDLVVVHSVTLENGILQIQLEDVPPSQSKTKSFEIK
jgi:molecular chaperone IbpA